MYCLVRGEGVPFYNPRRSVQARIKYGNVDNRLQEDKSESPAEMHLDGCTSRFGQTWGSTGPTLLILAPPFILDTARWAPILCMSVPGLCTSVFSVKWALLVSVMQDWIFYASVLILVYVFILFHVWVLANHNSLKLMELVRVKSYNYVWWLNIMERCRR